MFELLILFLQVIQYLVILLVKFKFVFNEIATIILYTPIYNV